MFTFLGAQLDEADSGMCAQVVGAAASGVASFAVDAQGSVWSWGTSKRGQLGQGMGITESAQPHRLPEMEGIVSMACGWGHALALRGALLSRMSMSQLLYGKQEWSMQCAQTLYAMPFSCQCPEALYWCELQSLCYLSCSKTNAMCMQRMDRYLHGAIRLMGAWVTSLTQAAVRWILLQNHPVQSKGG